MPDHPKYADEHLLNFLYENFIHHADNLKNLVNLQETRSS